MSRDIRSSWEKDAESKRRWSVPEDVTTSLEEEGIAKQYTWAQVKEFKRLMSENVYAAEGFADYVRQMFRQDYPKKASQQLLKGQRKEFPFKMTDTWLPTAQSQERHIHEWRIDIDYYRVLIRDFRWSCRDWGAACMESSWNEQFDAYVNSHWTAQSSWKKNDPDHADILPEEVSVAVDVRAQELTQMGESWRPNDELVEYAISVHGITQEFLEDHIKDFRLNEFRKQKTRSNWDDHWRKSLTSKWKKYRATPQYTKRSEQPDFLVYGGKNDDQELDYLKVEMSTQWRPGDDAKRLIMSATQLGSELFDDRLSLFVSKNLKLRKTQDEWERLLAKDIDIFKQYDDRWARDADRRSLERQQRYQQSGHRRGSGLVEAKEQAQRVFSDANVKDVTPSQPRLSKLQILEEVAKGNIDAINWSKD